MLRERQGARALGMCYVALRESSWQVQATLKLQGWQLRLCAIGSLGVYSSCSACSLCSLRSVL